MKIGFLSSWACTCGVAEMGSMLVEQFLAKEISCKVFGNTFNAEDLFEIPDELGLNVLRCFSTGFTHKPARHFNLTDIKWEIEEGRITHFIINYQSYLFPDIFGLNCLIQWLKERNIPVYAIIHDEALEPMLDWKNITIIAPPSLRRLGGAVIDQGIPEFELEHGLRSLNNSITCFGMGRNKLENLLEAVADCLVDLNPKTFKLNLVIPKPNHAPIDALKEKYPFLTPHFGYKRREDLAKLLHESMAVAIWYPSSGSIANSSAFRFAIGSKVPILAVRNNWISDYLDSGVFMPAEDSIESWTKQIQKLWKSNFDYALYREMMELHQEAAIQLNGWSQIADQYIELLSR